MGISVNNNPEINQVHNTGNEVKAQEKSEQPLYQYGAASPDDNGTSGKSYEPPKTPEELQKKIVDLLSKNGIDTDNADLIKDVTTKHNMIVSVAQAKGETLDESIVNMRLLNYAKGWRFHNFDKNALSSNEEYNSDCSKAKSFPELREKYKQFGKEYVEVMDQDGDGQINAHEMFYQELMDYYETNGLPPNQAKAKALATVSKFIKYNALNLPKEGDAVYNTEEALMFTDILIKIGVLDEDKNTTLSSDEAAAYLMSMAQLDDTKNNITSQENIRTELAIATDGMSVQEIMDLLGFTQEQAENIISYRAKFNNNLDAAQAFIETGNLPQ